MDGSLPDGWHERLHERADLEASLGELDGRQHFYAWTSRGRIRSLQARFEDADALLKRAAQLIDRAPATPSTAVEICAHSAVARENDILMGSPSSPFPVAPALLELADAKLRKVLLAHEGLDAAALLQDGDFGAALDRFQRLLCHQDAGHQARAIWTIGMALCLFNLEKHRAARVALCDAGWHVAAGPHLLCQVRLGARLESACATVGCAEEAEGWSRFVERLGAPEETKAALRRRAEASVVRQRELGYAVLL